MLAPPGTPHTIEDREAAIRLERAKRLEQHRLSQGSYSPQERAALREWEQRKAHAEQLEGLESTMEVHRRQLAPEPALDAPYTWKNDVSFPSPLCAALSGEKTLRK